MTAIIGLKTAEGVYIGADSCAQAGNTWITYPIASRKVFKRDGFLFGVAGSLRAIQLLQYKLQIPEHPERYGYGKAVEKYLVVDFVEAVRDLFKENGLSHIENNEETGNQFLLGYRGELFSINSDFALGAKAMNFFCIGSGMDVALGAMDALDYLGPGNEERRIEKALEITARFIANVSPPFHVEFLANKVNA